MKKLYIAICLLGIFSACKPKLNISKPTPGNANFAVYLAVGNSLTAGYADNSLYLTGQQNSYPQRLSEQFRLVGGGAFKQPLLMSDIGYPSPRLILSNAVSCLGVSSLAPVPNGTTIDYADTTNIASQGPFNNVGVPGIRCLDYLIPGYAILAKNGGAPFASRFYTNRATETPMDEALRIPATFFTCWLGNNDVLLYATSGGQGSDSGPLTTDITPVAFFQYNYDSVVHALTKNGAKGVLINIPDVTSVPFFTTIPANGLVLRQGQADSLNEAYAIQGFSTIRFSAGANPFVISDHNGAPRLIQAGEYLLLTIPQDSLTCGGWGSQKPIPNQYVLTIDEVNNIKTATAAFNSIISNTAQKYNLPYVDMNSYLHTVSSGINFNGASYNAVFVTGGSFSLDGVHLTPRGYALVANHILDAINAYYKSTIPAIDINKYPGVRFP